MLDGRARPLPSSSRGSSYDKAELKRCGRGNAIVRARQTFCALRRRLHQDRFVGALVGVFTRLLETLHRCRGDCSIMTFNNPIALRDASAGCAAVCESVRQSWKIRSNIVGALSVFGLLAGLLLLSR